MDDVPSTELDADGNAPIQLLPDELFDYIFTFLNIQERIATELVCKKWFTMGRLMTWSEPRRIIFNPHNRKADPMKGKWSLTDQSLQALLSRCGPSLRHLSVSKSHHPKHNPKYSVTITAEGLDTVANYCPNLEKIRLYSVPLSDKSLLKLGEGCSKLKSVHFVKFGDTDKGFSSFFKLCPFIEALIMEPNHDKVPILNFDLHNDRVHGEGFDVINPNLKILNLAGCDNVKPMLLQNLVVRCHCLEELRLTICYPESIQKELILQVLHHFERTLKILDLFLHLKPFDWCEALRGLRNLEELHLYVRIMVLQCPCLATKTCFATMSPRLRRLNVVSNSHSNSCDVEYVLSRVFTGCDRLEELCVERCTLSSNNLGSALKYTTTLRVLDLSKCRTDHFNWCGFFALFENLERLRLDLCNDVNDDVMEVLSRDCVKLRVLHVCSSNVTDEGLIHLAALPYLTILDVSDCGGIAGVGLEVLAAHGKLEELYAATCTDVPMNVTEESCRAVALFCPNFRLLDVSDLMRTQKITNHLVEGFCKSVEEGFLKNRVQLVVGGTAVTEDIQAGDKIDVIFNYYNHSFLNLPTIYPHAQGLFTSYPTF